MRHCQTKMRWACQPRDGSVERMLLLLAVIFGALLLMAVSLTDDLRGLSPAPRLMAQLVAIGIGMNALMPGGQVFQGWLPPGLDAFAAALLWLWFVNLFNFMDGIDGIAASEAAFVACCGAREAAQASKQGDGVVVAGLSLREPQGEFGALGQQGPSSVGRFHQAQRGAGACGERLADQGPERPDGAGVTLVGSPAADAAHFDGGDGVDERVFASELSQHQPSFEVAAIFGHARGRARGRFAGEAMPVMDMSIGWRGHGRPWQGWQ